MGKRIAAALLIAALLLAALTGAARGAVAWGDRGADVTKIQQRLRQFGYMSAPADGIFGQATAAALSAFQAKLGLAATGAADVITQEKIYAKDAPTVNE